MIQTRDFSGTPVRPPQEITPDALSITSPVIKTRDFSGTPVRIRDVVRPVFFALLFMNLAYFAWAHWIDAPRPPPVNEAIAHLPQLKLAEEAPAEQSQPRGAQKTSLSATACLSVGPFSDAAGGAQAAALLKTRGFEPRQRAEPGQGSANYWVYVGGLSQSDADAALVALERNGIADARVIPESGEAGRRLSLGIYSERVRAERRAEAVRQSGLKAEIAERKLSGTLYWVDLPAAPGVDAATVQNVLTERTNSRVTVQPCPLSAVPTPAVPIDSAAAPASPPERGPASASSPVAKAAETPRLP